VAAPSGALATGSRSAAGYDAIASYYDAFVDREDA
jgi:hypothetical protein